MEPVPWKELEAALELEIDNALEHFYYRIARNPCERFYLYYTEAEGDALTGNLVPCTIPLTSAEILADPEPIPINRDRAGVRAWIHEKTRRLPILNPYR